MTLSRLARVVALLAAVVLVWSCDDEPKHYEQPNVAVNKNRNPTDVVPQASRLEFPRLKGSGCIVLVHSTTDKEGVNLSIEWDADKKAQRWTAYRIHKGQSGNGGYDGNWEEDPDLPAYARVSDSNSYYRGSGFDRGHICPSADRQYSKAANHQTFYYTNMQPQYHMFNAGPRINGTQQYTSPWVRLEAMVRQWGRSSGCDTLYVVKGGTIDDDKLLGKIGNVLPIPKYFFVALLMKTKTDYQAAAFLIEHDNADHGANALADYAMNVRELEAFTGIDFFCNLPDDVEDRVETVSQTTIKMKWNL